MKSKYMGRSQMMALSEVTRAEMERLGPAVDGLDAHYPHQFGDVAPSRLVSPAAQFVHMIRRLS